MTEEIKPTSTPRKRRSFGMRDLRRLHRRSGEHKSLKEWARKASASIRSDRAPSDKVKGLLG